MSITLLSVRNPQWKTLTFPKSDENGEDVKDSNGDVVLETVLDSNGDPIKVIDCECKWSHLGDESQEWVMFAANKNDTEAHGKQLYEDLVAGKYGAIADES